MFRQAYASFCRGTPTGQAVRQGRNFLKILPIRKNRCIQTEIPVLYYTVFVGAGRPFSRTAPLFFGRKSPPCPGILCPGCWFPPPFSYFSAAGRASPFGQINDGLSFTKRIWSIRVTQPNVCRRNGAGQTAGVSSLRAPFSAHASPLPFINLWSQPEGRASVGVRENPCQGPDRGCVHRETAAATS